MRERENSDDLKDPFVESIESALSVRSKDFKNGREGGYYSRRLQSFADARHRDEIDSR